MYPIKFENVYFDKIWGGRDLEDFRDNLPHGNIGESWDVACHKTCKSVVANGIFKGRTFDSLISEYQEDLIGTCVDKSNFPLLVKLINSKSKLSVQVHPNDDYGYKVENQPGKTEAWYVIDAKPGAKLVMGTKNCNKDIFRKAIEDGNCEDYLNTIEVKKGDCFLIKSGLVHAIGAGLMIAEIQQNSDVTYRVYDYGRPRELHIEKSLDVIDFELKAVNLSDKAPINSKEYSTTFLCENEYFGMYKIDVKKEWSSSGDILKFHILTCVDGEGYIHYNSTKEKIKKGDSYLIPASLKNYHIKGSLSLINSYPM